ncbi:MAG TPA: response regulator [Gammaproteobacteria bacterium]|nr:response regulator [Gammaproteobacteria bacterium]
MAKILAVDDSKSIRDLVSHILSTENHEVISACDGVEALALARQTPVDIALIDVNMPNMNGLSLVSKLRKLESYKFIPIVMVTTETDEYRKKKARNVGASGWLAKPFTAERLVAAVNKLIA